MHESPDISASPSTKDGQDSAGKAERIAAVFGSASFDDLPAMSDHVQELLALTNSSRSTARELAEVILRDNSLTAKVLQVVNSAYYNRGTPVTTISRAVTAVGFNVLRELAVSIAIIEEFIKAGVEKDGISMLLTQSFLSALLAKNICLSRKIKVAAEEAFICSLLHNLGKILVIVYLPEVYRQIGQKVAEGYSEEYAAKLTLKGLSLSEIGMELARFWNLTDKITLSMHTHPDRPANLSDTNGYLQNLAAFSNKFIASLGMGSQLELTDLVMHYKPVLNINKTMAVRLTETCIEAAEDVSEILRYGLFKLQIRSKLTALCERG